LLHKWTDGGPHLQAARAIALALLSSITLLGGCAGTATRPEVTTDDAAAPEFPTDAMDRYAEALGWMDAGEDLQAAEIFRALAADYPDYAGPLVNLAIIEARAGRTDDSIRLLENALVVCTTCAPAWNQLGILFRRQGRFAEAEAAYLKALDADADYALAHYNLGVLYDLYQQQPASAVQHYELYVLLVDDDAQAPVDKWIADLRRRIGQPPQTAQAEGT
jgi:tetratricopeptide (TPR) repeat protein